MNQCVVYKPYEKAEEVAEKLMANLEVKLHDARTTIVRHDGKSKGGYRVTVTRLSDGMRTSRFVWDDGVVTPPLEENKNA